MYNERNVHQSVLCNQRMTKSDERTEHKINRKRTYNETRLQNETEQCASNAKRNDETKMSLILFLLIYNYRFMGTRRNENVRDTVAVVLGTEITVNCTANVMEVRWSITITCSTR